LTKCSSKIIWVCGWNFRRFAFMWKYFLWNCKWIHEKIFFNICSVSWFFFLFFLFLSQFLFLIVTSIFILGSFVFHWILYPVCFRLQLYLHAGTCTDSQSNLQNDSLMAWAQGNCDKRLVTKQLKSSLIVSIEIFLSLQVREKFIDGFVLSLSATFINAVLFSGKQLWCVKKKKFLESV